MFNLNKHSDKTFVVTFSADRLADKLLKQNATYQEYKDDNLDDLNQEQKNEITIATNTVNAIMDVVKDNPQGMAHIFDAVNGWVKLNPIIQVDVADVVEGLAKSKEFNDNIH